MSMTVLTVGQVTSYIKSLLDGDRNLNPVFISGEISNFTDHYRSGHLYFSLKDEKAVLKAVMFSSSARRLRFRPADGMKVLCRGRISLYEASGQYQLYVDDMQPDGLGALNLAYEQLKARLEKEGTVRCIPEAAHPPVSPACRRYHLAHRRSCAGYLPDSGPPLAYGGDRVLSGAGAGGRGGSSTGGCLKADEPH